MEKYKNINITKVHDYFSKNGYIEHLEVINEIEDIIDNFNRHKHTAKFEKLFIDAFNRFPYTVITEYNGTESIITTNRQRINTASPNAFNDLKRYLNNIKTFNNLKILDSDDKRIVLVGPNGAGKTTLVRNIYPLVSSSSSYFVLPSERIVTIANDYSAGSYEQVKSQVENAIVNRGDLYLDMGPIINLLKEERRIENECLRNGDKCNDVVNKILIEWNHLSKTREIKFNPELKAFNNNTPYDISLLSSGEKTMLALISIVLLLNEYDYYFIDEPENTLNPSIVSELCDYIESQRPNSVFVYLTHNSDFVSSRKNAKVYWITGYDGKKWDFKEIKANSGLPSDLSIKLVGIKSSILFCESDDLKKYDAKLFSIIFHDYKIVPAQGCDVVKRYVNAYGISGMPNEYMGIIDRDYNFSFDDLETINKLKEKHIYVLPYFEIENMLFREDIIKGVLLFKGVSEDDAIEKIKKAKDCIFNDFYKDIDKLATKFVASERHRKSDYGEKIKSLTNIEEFKSLYSNSHLSDEEIDDRFRQYHSRFNQIFLEKNYEELLKYYDCKGMFNKYHDALGLKTDEYEKIVFEYLESEQAKELLEQLKADIVV